MGVSPDNVDALKKFSGLKSISFPLLADTESKVIRALKLENKNGLPHPGTIVVDSAGIVQGKIFLDGYRKRHPNKALLELVGSLQMSDDESEAKQAETEGTDK